ncbi:universal stress protein [Segetibacter koreensis]|uniref:universal stress protein n=1 Tax=Segetibacter koreensis TaxID=398037 RepID=UPI00037D0E6F|nr:universal stress protein [Segetibacter koreensis]
MKTILIATDFSSAARNATIYGFELARLIRAKVILFTAFTMPAALPESSLYLTSKELERNSYKQLLDEAETIDPRRTIALETQSRQGPVSSSILSAALEYKASYIIVGMKERGKEIRKYFGSAVTDLCKHSQVPLIVVPADAVFSIPKTIALASDITDDTDIQILEPLKKIVEKFESRLFVVRVIKNSMDEVASRVIKSKKLIWFLTSLYPSYVFPKARNVAKAMIAFVKQYAVDLVAVIPHEHTLFERLFTKSVTKNMIFRTPVPLLILPEKKDTIKEEPGKEIDGSEVISAA